MVQQSFGQIPSYKCTAIGYDEKICKLSNVNQTSSQKNFKVISHRNVSEVDTVYFEVSKMETLTEDLCDALPYVESFYVDRLGLTSVDENAFKKCMKLKKVHLNGNLLTSLPLELFDSNVDLSSVWLQENNLTKINESLFKNNPNLWEISLASNQLQEFSFLTEMPGMRVINLGNNELSDVDVENLLEKCPNLEQIYLYGNKFSCDRQHQIITALDAKNIHSSFGACIH